MALSSELSSSNICISMWLGVPSYLSFNVAWSSELFVFRCDLEFRAICISPWLGVPSYFYFTVAWSSELSSSICIFSLHGHKSLHFYCSIIADLFLKHRITGMSYLWRLILNIMIPIIACTAISSISRVGNATYLAWRTRCLLRSSGGGRAAARHATIFSMPRRIVAQ